MRAPLVVAIVVAVLLMALGCSGSGSGTEPTIVRPSLASTRFSLANGLDVVLHPVPLSRTVSVNVRYDVGSRHDPEGASGIAHLVQHLMFRTKLGGRGDPFAVYDELGGRLDAATLQDVTGYLATITAEELPTAVFVEAARMARPLDGVDEPAFSAERDMVRKERFEGVDNVPYGDLDVLASSLLFDGGPYGRPIVGTPEDLARITLADARRFATAYYRPNNATLVIAGRFDPRATTALVHELFDAIPAAPLPGGGVVTLASSRASVRRIVPTGVAAPAVIVAWVVPAAGRPGWHEIALAADLLDPELKQRMGRNATRVTVLLEQRDAGSVLVVGVELAPDASVAAAIETIDAALDDLANARIASERIGEKKRRSMTKFALDLEDQEHRTNVIQSFLTQYDRADGVEVELQRIASVGRDDIARVVETYLRKGRRVTLEARPDPRAPKAGLWPARLVE